MADQDLPQPRFDESTPKPSAENKVKCWWESCDKMYPTWKGLAQHIKLKHKKDPTAWKDTYYYKQYYLEKNKIKQRQAAAKRKNRGKVAAKKKLLSGDDVESGCDSSGDDVESDCEEPPPKIARSTPASSSGLGGGLTPPPPIPGLRWVVKESWVLATEDGTPIVPPCFGGLVNPCQRPTRAAQEATLETKQHEQTGDGTQKTKEKKHTDKKEKKAKDKKQKEDKEAQDKTSQGKKHEEDKSSKPGPSLELACTSPTIDLAAGAVPQGVLACSSPVATDISSASAFSSGIRNPLMMLHNMCANIEHTTAWVKEQQDTMKWTRSLPTVNVKAHYISFECPPALGELNANGEVVERCNFPKELVVDRVEATAFETWYRRQAGKKKTPGDYASKVVMGAERALGMLELTPNACKPDAALVDVEVLVALCKSEAHIALMEMNFMDPKYGWPPFVIQGLQAFTEFQLYQLNQSKIRGEGAFFNEYKTVLDQLLVDLGGGWNRRFAEHKAKMLVKKHQKDLEIIKAIEIPELQHAVLKAYVTLQRIRDAFGAEPLTKKARSVSNQCMAVGIGFDTFSGRKKEWEILLHLYIMDVIAMCEKILVCSDHKTAKTYGSIAKLLTPGLFEAFVCYASFFRPPGCEYFLVSPFEGKKYVHLPKALASGCERFLKNGHVHPTFTQLRKLFHRQLMKIQGNEEMLKEVMVILDAHSKAVQASHYILKDPKDDALLAEHLVKVVLGKTVSWPTSETVAQMLDEDQELRLKTTFSKEEGEKLSEGEEADDNDEEDEEPDEYFDGAEMWGIKQERSLLVICDQAPLPRAGQGVEPIPLEDAQNHEGEAEQFDDLFRDDDVVEKKDTESKKDNKEKKEKKKKKERKNDKKEMKDEKDDASDDLLSESDKAALLNHMVKSRIYSFSLDEKEFIVKELRKAQGTSNSVPTAPILKKIIADGRELNILTENFQDAGEYFKKIRNFVRLFLKQLE